MSGNSDNPVSFYDRIKCFFSNAVLFLIFSPFVALIDDILNLYQIIHARITHVYEGDEEWKSCAFPYCIVCTIARILLRVAVIAIYIHYPPKPFTSVLFYLTLTFIEIIAIDMLFLRITATFFEIKRKRRGIPDIV